MKRAREVVLGLGGIEQSRVFTRIWLALFGEWSWDDLPALPPEVILLPSWFPLNVYDFACWARQTIVPLTIVASHRPVRPLPFSLAELRAGVARARRCIRSRRWKGRLQRLDRALQWYERHPLRPAARARAPARVRVDPRSARRPTARGAASSRPGCTRCSRCTSRAIRSIIPRCARALHGFERFTIDEGDVRRLEACQSPVWDTALAMIALRDAGVAPDHPALARAAEWTLREEVRDPGRLDRAPPAARAERLGVRVRQRPLPRHRRHRRGDPRAARGAHARRRRARRPRSRARSRGRSGMQSSDGGFAAFDADNTRALCRELPFCDFGEVIDPPSRRRHRARGRDARARGPRRTTRACASARRVAAARAGAGRLVVRALGRQPSLRHRRGGARARRRGRPARSRRDPPRGALARIGAERRRRLRRGSALLHRRGCAGLGDSTASQTAWALLALLAAGERGRAVERAVDWLARTQRADGDWDEPQFTGTGFPGDFYIRYHLYRLVFPIMALGRYASLRASRRRAG